MLAGLPRRARARASLPSVCAASFAAARRSPEQLARPLPGSRSPRRAPQPLRPHRGRGRRHLPRVPCARPRAGPVPIGRPIANIDDLRARRAGCSRCRSGVPGELYLGGVGVARGYLGRPDAHRRALRPRSLRRSPAARLYRTGDLAAWLPDGAARVPRPGRPPGQDPRLPHRARRDRGRPRRASRPCARRSWSCARGRAGRPAPRRLPGRRRPRARRPPSCARTWPSRLPEYMVPAAFVLLEALPLTASGKVDRQALPGAERCPRAEETALAARATRLEERWPPSGARCCGLERVGVHDNFFELGGHSLLATRVAARAGPWASTSRCAPLRGAHRRRAGRGDYRRPGAACPAPPIEPLRGRSGDAPVLRPGAALVPPPARGAPGSTPITSRLPPAWKGRSTPKRCGGPSATWSHRHEPLRTTFRLRGAEPVQVVNPPSPFELPLADIRGLVPEAREAEMLQARAKRPEPPST